MVGGADVGVVFTTSRRRRIKHDLLHLAMVLYKEWCGMERDHGAATAVAKPLKKICKPQPVMPIIRNEKSKIFNSKCAVPVKNSS